MARTVPWTGRTACALQRALRMSQELFAAHLDIGVRTVARWHQMPDSTPRSEQQQRLDVAYERASAEVKARFAALVGDTQAADDRDGPARPDDVATAEAERRLRADSHIASALEWLDEHAGWASGTSRRKVAETLAILDVSRLADRGAKRGRVGQRDVRRALADYYSGGLEGFGTYAATVGEIDAATTILTRADWLDMACPLRGPADRLRLGRSSDDAEPQLCSEAADSAVRRLAETLELGTRLVDMPLYRLQRIAIDGTAVDGTVGVAPFVEYALTMDLLEGELLDVLASGGGTRARLPLRDRYLPDISSVVDIDHRLCAGGVLALCAIARPQGFNGEPDYLILVQQRSGNVLNANRQLAVIPKGFHQPISDVRQDAEVGYTLLREIEEELFGGDDVDNTTGPQRFADPMHPNRLSEPMTWLLAEPLGRRLRLECTGFGLNVVSGNFEFASLVLIEDEEFWDLYGDQIEANWESANLRRYSSRDAELLSELIADPAWSNEGLFAFLQGLRRLAQIGGQRVDLPQVEWELR